MTYTIKQLASLAGVSTRTLRYYDEIGLLAPHHINHSGYRIYQEQEVDRLQQILFFRELDVALEDIKVVLADPTFDFVTLLTQHRAALVNKKQRLTALIAAVDLTIATAKGEKQMTDQDKFAAFKEELVAENEHTYGNEVREKYGQDALDTSNATLLNMTETAYYHWQEQEKELLELLKKQQTLALNSADGEKIFQLHKAWLTQSWGHYSAESHRGIVDMYRLTPEFTAYYDDKAGTGATEFLAAVVHHYA